MEGAAEHTGKERLEAHIGSRKSRYKISIKELEKRKKPKQQPPSYWRNQILGFQGNL